MADTSPVEALAQFIERHPRLFVLTGAGVSTDSGIPDYRDSTGAWKHSQPMQYQDFMASDFNRRRYWARSMIGWMRFGKAEPNASHIALARLEHAGFIQQLVTQNVDGLHQRAGSRKVIDLHGRLDRVDCLDCGQPSSRNEVQQHLIAQNPDFSQLTAASAPDGDAVLENIDFNQFRAPACVRCDGKLKPSVVFFGENVPKLRVQRALASLADADALLVVGSSLMVFSGYRFCRAAGEQNKPMAAINLGRTRADADLNLKISQPCGEVLAQLVDRLGISSASHSAQ